MACRSQVLVSSTTTGLNHTEHNSLPLWPQKYRCSTPAVIEARATAVGLRWSPSRLVSLPDAVRGFLGFHPSAPPLSVFVDFRAALGHVDCCQTRAVVGDWVVTSTVGIKQLCEVCATLLLAPMKQSSHFERASKKEIKKLLSVVGQDFLLVPRSALTFVEVCTNHRCETRKRWIV